MKHLNESCLRANYNCALLTFSLLFDPGGESLTSK